MVTINPYRTQTQASGISQQNSGGNGYIGNAGMQAVGQALGGVADRALGIDAESIQKAQAQEKNRNKFESEIAKREQKKFFQDQSLQATANLYDAERAVLAKSEDLKLNIGDKLSEYPQQALKLFDDEMGKIVNNTHPDIKPKLQLQIMQRRQRIAIDSEDYARKTQIDKNIVNIQSIGDYQINTVNSNLQSLQQAKDDYANTVQTVLIGQPEKVRMLMIKEHNQKADKKYYEARLNTDAPSLIDELKNEKNLTPLQQTTLFKAQKKIETDLKKAETERLKKESIIKNDPGKYLQDKGEFSAQNTFDLQISTPESLRKVLPNDTAQQYSMALQNVKSVDEMQSWVQNLEGTIDNPDLLNNAFTQLENDASLPREYKAVLSFDPYKDSEEMRYLFDALNSNKQDFNTGFKTALSAKGVSQTDFSDALNQELSYIQGVEFKQGVSASGVADISETLQTLAKSHFLKHGGIDDAVSFAKQAYLKDYHNDGDELLTVDGVPTILPKQFIPDPEIAINYLEMYKENNAKQLFFVGDTGISKIDDTVKESIMDTAYFGLAPTGDGLILFSDTGLELLNQDKQPIKVLFGDISAKDVKKQQIQDIIQASEKVKLQDLASD
jgi:hypothetical protein